MKRVFLNLTAVLGLLWISFSCNNDDSVEIPEPGKGEIVEIGEITTKVAFDFKPASYQNGTVFLATNDGVWSYKPASKEWKQLGFKNLNVTLVYAHPTISNLVFASVTPTEGTQEKSFYYSENGGESWTASETGIYDNLDNKYEVFYDITVRPKHPEHLYANLSGTTIAVSTDKGKNWKRVNGKDESYFGYQSNLVFLPNEENKIYQGSENPLDFAWLGEYTIANDTPSVLKDYKQLVNLDVWSNRRPVELATYSHTGNAIYVGQEGALSKVTGTEVKYIFKVDEDNTTFPYTYVYGVWVDPANSKHLLFGGAINGTQSTLSLYETYDEGKTVVKFDTNLGMTQPFVHKILATEKEPILIISDKANDKVKLYTYKTK